MRFNSLSFSLLVIPLFGLTACATPTLLGEGTAPIQNIVDDVVCSVHNSLVDIRDEQNTSAVSEKDGIDLFDVNKWAIGIVITPKATSIYDAGIGGTAKSNPHGKDGLYSVVGNLTTIDQLPSANININGYTQATVSYLIQSQNLVQNQYFSKLNLNCDGARVKHLPFDVVNGLSIKDWIIRSAAPLNGQILAMSKGTEAGSSSGADLMFEADLQVYEGADASLSYIPVNLKWAPSANLGFKKVQEIKLDVNFIPSAGNVLQVIPVQAKARTKSAPTLEYRLPPHAAKEKNVPAIPFKFVQPSPGAIQTFQAQKLLLNPSLTIQPQQ